MTLEQDVQRRQTTAFIATNPVSIALIPRTSTKTNTGGVSKATSDPREPQTFRLVEPSDSGFRYTIRTAEATQLAIEFMLLGEWNAVIGKDDVFTHEGREYKVDSLMPNNGYEQRALVIRHGW